MNQGTKTLMNQGIYYGYITHGQYNYQIPWLHHWIRAGLCSSTTEALRLMVEYNDAWFVLIGGWIQVRASVTSMDI